MPSIEGGSLPWESKKGREKLDEYLELCKEMESLIAQAGEDVPAFQKAEARALEKKAKEVWGEIPPELKKGSPGLKRPEEAFGVAFLEAALLKRKEEEMGGFSAEQEEEIGKINREAEKLLEEEKEIIEDETLSEEERAEKLRSIQEAKAALSKRYKEII